MVAAFSMNSNVSRVRDIHSSAQRESLLSSKWLCVPTLFQWKYWIKKLGSSRFKVGLFGLVASVIICGTSIYVKMVLYTEQLPLVSKICDEAWQVIELVKKDHNSNESAEKVTHMKSCRGDTLGFVFPWVLSKSDNPWILLRLAKSQNPVARIIGVEAITRKHNWADFQYREISQASDYRMQVGFARTANVNEKLFRPPPRPPEFKYGVYKQLQQLLLMLPSCTEDKCIEYFTKAALNKESEKDLEGNSWYIADTGTEFSKNVRILPESKLSIYLLQALYRHSLVANNCMEIVRGGGLVFMQLLYQENKDSIFLKCLCAQILGNLAQYSQLHTDIVRTGWVTILAEWFQSDNLTLHLHTARALANLDTDCTLGMYQDGVYILHPIHRTKQPVYADVIFVHGLLGGPFKSWRQDDRVKQKIASDVDQIDEYTYCWPKDWLAEDCPNIRILTVEYDTYLTEYSAPCPYDKKMRALPVRAAILRQRLQKAGVGDRPIVWVGHSMGGLLIKQMLLLDDGEKDKQMLKNTKGIIFYSVPHRGSTLAASYSRQSTFSPSVEVQELTSDSSFLKSMHGCFKNLLMKSNIDCLSFGEMNKTPLRMKFSAQVVPLESSDPGFGVFYPMNADHLNICKPLNQDSLLYVLTVKHIKKWTQQTMVDRVVKAGLSVEN